MGVNRRNLLGVSLLTLAGTAVAGLPAWKHFHPSSAGSAPTNTVAPTISGATPAGSTLTVSTGTWTGSPTFTYQWKKNGSAIVGQTATTYVTVSGDVGSTITCDVTGTNGFGSLTVGSSNSIVVTAAPSFPLVAPGAGWNGTQNSGFGTVPVNTPYRHITDPALPAVRWFTPNGDLYTSNTVMGVSVKCNGTINSVSVNMNGNVVALTPNTLYTDTDPRTGLSRTRNGAWFTYDNATAFGKGFGVTAVITAYVTVVATITGNGGSTTYTTEPMFIFPRGLTSNPVDTRFDKVYQVDQTLSSNTPTSWGGTFKNLASVLTQYNSDQPKQPAIMLMRTDTYLLPNFVFPGNWLLFNGRTEWIVAPGVTATLTKNATFIANPANGPTAPDSDWVWQSFTGQARFNKGIKFDLFSFYAIASFGCQTGLTKVDRLGNTSNPQFGHIYEGCEITNSNGRDTLYWNKQPAPRACFGDNSSLISGAESTQFNSVWMHDCQAGVGNDLASGCFQDTSLGNKDGAIAVFNHFETNSNPGFFTQTYGAISVTYSGSGTFTWTIDPNSNTFDAKINGVSQTGFPATIVVTVGQPITDPLFAVSTFTSMLNAIPNVSATTLDNTKASYALLGGTNKTQVGAGTFTIDGAFPNHTEWVHFNAINPNPPPIYVQNVIRENAVVTNSWWTTDFWSFGAGGLDIWFGNICATESTLSGGTGGLNGDHISILGCVYPSGLQISDMGGTKSLVAYSVINGVILGSLTGNNGPVLRDNACVGSVSLTNMATGSGNNSVLANNAAFNACFQNLYPGVNPGRPDPRPAGVLLGSPNLWNQPERIYGMGGGSNSVASYVTLTSSDAIGTYALSQSAPVYPT